MKWRKDPGGWYSEAAEGYVVSRAVVCGEVIYTAWAPCRSSNPYTAQAWAAIGYYKQGDGAAAACDKHYALQVMGERGVHDQTS